MLKGKRAASVGFFSCQTGLLEPLVAVSEGLSPADRIRPNSSPLHHLHQLVLQIQIQVCLGYGASVYEKADWNIGEK